MYIHIFMSIPVALGSPDRSTQGISRLRGRQGQGEDLNPPSSRKIARKWSKYREYSYGYIYIYVCICVYIYIYMCIYIYVCTHVYTCRNILNLNKLVL